ncbi:MAG: DUF4422 domain-containing protein [Helicobacteraceae bacterium]|jgi:lipopolysaccharide biosynthesis glycosyltransferase|nr:DUF4422 domain-containing protein [Helicobacteraceae bacterium]
MQTPKIKILVGYHKPATLLKSEIFTPIHLGRAIAQSENKDGALDENDLKWMLDNMIGDDTGDNISDRNRNFNELTAFYWAWKNLDKLDNPDYIGFMHYRRHLSFSSEKLPEDNQMYKSFALDDEYIQKCRLSDDNVVNKISGYDVVIKSRHRLPGTPYQHYEHNDEGNTHIKDYDTALRVLAEQYPEYKSCADKYNGGKFAYFTNTIILRTELFVDYCKWLFNILFATWTQIDISNYNAQEARAIAYISEWLMGIYITHMQDTTKFRILELQGTFIENTDYGVIANIQPAFDENNIPIVFACEGDYYLYTAVALCSLIQRASPQKNYDIIILADARAHRQRLQLIQLAANHSNVNIRVIKALSYIDGAIYNSLFISHHIAKSAYYRLFIPRVLPAYNKILYFDSDILIYKDVAELFNINLGNNSIAATTDIVLNISFYLETWAQGYFTDKLGIKNPRDYFNSGVLVMNLTAIRDKELDKSCLAKLRELNNPTFWDQDVLNCVYKGQAKRLDLKWNHQFAIPYQKPNYAVDCPTEFVKEYIANIDDHYITHFTDSFKPWIDPSRAPAEKFWFYARQTPFYDEIILKNIAKVAQSQIDNIYRLLREIYYMDKLIYNKRRYKLFYLLSLGIAKKYKAKYNNAKNRLKQLQRSPN